MFAITRPDLASATLLSTTTACSMQLEELMLAANLEVSQKACKLFVGWNINPNPGEGGKRKVSNFVLDSLPPKMRDKGVKSKKYKQVHAQTYHF